MNWTAISLRTRLLAATVTTMVLGFSVTGGIVTYQSYQTTRAQGEALAHSAAEEAAREVALTLDNAMGTARNLAFALEGLDRAELRNRAAVNAMLRRTLEGQPALLATYTGWEPDAFDGEDARHTGRPGHDESGRFMPYWSRNGATVVLEPLVDYTQAGAGDYYLLPRRTGEAQLIDPYLYPVGGQQVLITSLVQPVKRDGRFVGIAGVDIALDALQRQLSALTPLESGHVALYTGSGQVVSHPDPARLGQAAELPPEALAALRAGHSLRWSDAAGRVNFLEPIKMHDVVAPWGTVVSVPGAAITAAADRLRTTALTLGAASVAFTSLTVFLLLTALTRPLNQLANAMRELASGEGDLTRRLVVTRDDELGRAARALNVFLDSLQGMFRQVRERSQTLLAGLDSVAHATGQVADGSRMLTDTASGNAATIEQITASIGSIADHANDADQVMHQTGALSQRSGQAVRSMEEQMRNINHTIEQLAASLSGLSARSDQISNVIQVIREIADQTNLLALNAAIEAARAGEQGRGFAVVADEVRKLAERTSLATQEIRQTITSIRDETISAVAGMTSTREVVESGMASAERVAAEIGAIERSLETAAGRVRDIAHATREQSSATTALARSVEAASDMVQANDATIRAASATLSRLGTTSDELGALVARFKL